MKIAICACEARTEAEVSRCAGKSPYFALCNTEDGTVEFVKNPALDEENRCGLAAVEALGSSPAVIVVGNHFGSRVFRGLSLWGLSLFHADAGSVRDLIDRCVSGELELLQSALPCHARFDEPERTRRDFHLEELSHNQPIC